MEDEIMIQLKETAARESRTLTEVVQETLKKGLRYRNRSSDAKKTWKCASFEMGGGFDYTQAWNKINEQEVLAVAEKMDLRK